MYDENYVEYDEYGNVVTNTESDNNEDDVVTKDSNGNVLQDGDDVILTQDLKMKGGSKDFKRGDVFKNIKLTGDPEYIDVKSGKTLIALKTCYTKKK